MTRPGDSVSDRGHHVRARPAPSGRVGRKRTIRCVDPADGERSSARDGPAGAAALRTDGRILVDQLELNGTDLAFCLPGETTCRARRAVRLADPPDRAVTSRVRRTRRRRTEAHRQTGSALVTRGGATQAAVGVHGEAGLLAMSSSSARCRERFVGAKRGRSSTTATCSGCREGGMGDRFRRPHSRAHGRGVLDRAVRQARAGRARARRTSSPRSPPPPMPIRSRPSRSCPRREISSGCGTCSPAPSARRRGKGGWTAETSRDVQAFCEANELPVACAFRCQDFVDNRSPSYVGVLGVAMDEAIAGRLRDADLVLALGGPRRGARAATLSRAPHPQQTLIHAHPDAVSSAVSTAGSRTRRDASRWPPPCARSIRWRASGASGRTRRAPTTSGISSTGRWKATSTSARSCLPSPPASGDAVQDLRARNFTVWAHRFAQFTQFGTQACPRSGRWDAGSPRRWQRSSSIRSAWSSASPVTATSS